MAGDYLSALALLKTAYDQHGATYLDYVMPFVGDTIRSTGMTEINSSTLRDALANRYGLEIPDGVLNTLTRRLAKQGFGRRSHGQFIPNKEKLVDSYSFDEQRASSQQAINELAASFISFVRVEIGRDLSTHEATGVLTEYADKHGLPILRSAYRRQAPGISLSPNETEYITSRFVVHAFEGSLPEMDTLVMLAKGSKLASVLYLTDPQGTRQKVRDVVALFDTPCLLYALGYQGREQEQNARREMLELAHQSGLKLAVFDHTIAEIESILNTVSMTVRRKGYSGRIPGVEANFLERRYGASDILLLVEKLTENLRPLRVSIVERPDIRVEWSVDEVKLGEKLMEEVGYQRSEPMRHDLDALTATFRQRKGRFPERFEHCRAVFVTTNTPLVRASTQFFNDEYSGHFPLAITEDAFATLLWLKKPLACPDLPLRQVVADAYAALEPGLVSWESFLDETDKLHDQSELSEEDYFLLRFSSEAKAALMQMTKGERIAVTADDVLQVLNRAKHSITTPIQQRADEEAAELSRAEEAAKHQQEVFAVDLAKVESERDQAIEQASAASLRLGAANDSLRDMASRKAVRYRKMLILGVAVVAFVGLWVSTLDWGLPSDDSPTALHWLAHLAIFALIAITVGNLGFGWSVVQLGRRAEDWMKDRLERRYRRNVGLDEAGEPDTSD